MGAHVDRVEAPRQLAVLAGEKVQFGAGLGERAGAFVAARDEEPGGGHAPDGAADRAQHDPDGAVLAGGLVGALTGGLGVGGLVCAGEEPAAQVAVLHTRLDRLNARLEVVAVVPQIEIVGDVLTDEDERLARVEAHADDEHAVGEVVLADELRLVVAQVVLHRVVDVGVVFGEDEVAQLAHDLGGVDARGVGDDAALLVVREHVVRVRDLRVQLLGRRGDHVVLPDRPVDAQRDGPADERGPGDARAEERRERAAAPAADSLGGGLVLLVGQRGLRSGLRGVAGLVAALLPVVLPGPLRSHGLGAFPAVRACLPADLLAPGAPGSSGVVLRVHGKRVAPRAGRRRGRQAGPQKWEEPPAPENPESENEPPDSPVLVLSPGARQE